MVLVNDNEKGRSAIEQCYARHKTVLNPIIDWTDAEVWEFIKEYNVPYCKLYDEGFKRLGCVGCPMNTNAREELNRWPTIKKVYLQAFDKMLEIRRERERDNMGKCARSHGLVA